MQNSISVQAGGSSGYGKDLHLNGLGILLIVLLALGLFIWALYSDDSGA